jgi:hypothetical protein
MAKVDIEDGWLTVRVSWLERWLLSEKPRRCPLDLVQSVNPHPDLLDMLLYWTDQRGVWLYGATTHEGYLVPSTRNPYSTLAIQVVGQRTWYVELDDQEPSEVAAEIEQAMGSSVLAGATAASGVAAIAAPDIAAIAVPDIAASAVPDNTLPQGKSLGRNLQQREKFEEEDEEIAAGGHRVRKRRFHLSEDRDLSRVGHWLVAAGTLGMLAGMVIVAAGLLPGLIAVGAGMACAVIGGLTLGLRTHHQS